MCEFLLYNMMATITERECCLICKYRNHLVRINPGAEATKGLKPHRG